MMEVHHDKIKSKNSIHAGRQDCPCPVGDAVPPAMIKNFSAGDIWVGVTPDSTKTDGMIRIPSEGAQLLVSFCAGQYGDLIDTVYVMADAAEENCVEVQALEW